MPFTTLAALGALCYYQAESNSGVGDGGGITTWPDLSGNARTIAPQFPGVIKPTYRANVGSAGPAVQFADASFDDSVYTASIAHGIGATDLSLWMLFRAPTTQNVPNSPGLTFNNGIGLFSLSRFAGGGKLSLNVRSGQPRLSVGLATYPITDPTLQLTDDLWHTLILTRDTSGFWHIDVDFRTNTPLGGGNTTIWDQTSIADGEFGIGVRPASYIKDAGFIDRALTLEERHGLQEYLATRAPVTLHKLILSNEPAGANPATWGRTRYAGAGRLYGGFTKPARTKDWPRVEAYCAFGTNPAATPVWVDISSRVRGMWIRRGRQTELSRYEAGTAGVILDNRDRALDPSNTASEWWPNIRPMRRFRLAARWGFTSYPLFTGYVERWPPSWDEHGSDGTVEVQLVDAFKVLSLRKLSTSFTLARSDVRIATALALIGWPTTEQMLMVGQSNVQGVTLDKVPALEHLQAVEEAENGQFFVRGDGTLIFLDRLTPSLAGVGGGVFGDADAELPYETLSFEFGDEQIWNEIRMTRAGGAEQVVSDAGSITQYLQRTYTKTGMLTTSDGEVLAAAQYVLAKRKQPIFRFPTMRVNPMLDPEALWPIVLGTDLSTALTVRRRPPDITSQGPMIERTVSIQGISIDVSRGKWTTDYSLGEPDIQALFQLDSPTNAQLDSTAILSF